MTRKPLVAGNWKMNGSAEAADRFGEQLLSGGADLSCDLAICVPFVYLERMARALSGSRIGVGGQNLSAESEPGAFTGEINGEMLVDAGCSHVIVGHSERRAMYGDTDAVVVAKLKAALAAGLKPIVCIGETLEQREAEQTEVVLSAQLDAVLDAFQPSQLATLILAYEPVWAIGTGRSASPEQAQEVHEFLRKRIATRDADLAESMPVVYGGSVKPDNAAEIFAGADVDGALVGGASLTADSFLDIARAAQ